MLQYQATLNDPDSLNSTITLLKHTSFLVEFAHDLTSLNDTRFEELEQVRLFFFKLEWYR